jgi:flagellin-like protein
MRKGITPIIAVIILLLITVALAGMAWAFLNNYFVGLTGKTISVVDYSCLTGGTAQIIIRNSGTDTISLSPPVTCQQGLINGATVSCGDLTITKTSGTITNGNLSTASIAKEQSVTFTDSCAATSCTYRFVTSSGGIGGPNPNIATVNCP